MMAHVDTIASAVVVCAAVWAVPSDHWSLSFLCGDLALICFAAVAYWALSHSRQRFKANLATGMSAKDCYVVDAVHETTENELPSHCSVEHATPQEQQTECFDVDQHVKLMQKYASERNISGAMRTFRIIQQSGCCLDSLIYNTILRAWINCGNVQAAEDWMEEMKEAGMADEASFTLLIKALVKESDLDKANALVEDMREAQLQPGIDILNELLCGYAQEGLFDDGLSLLEEMHSQGMRPNDYTLGTIVKLVDSARGINQQFDRLEKVLLQYGIEPSKESPCSELAEASNHQHLLKDPFDASLGIEPQVVPPHAVLPCPRLAAVLLQAKEATSRLCAHEVRITGTLAQIKAIRRTLKQYGFMDKDGNSEWPLNGHWTTEHGLTVIIEGKCVRWSRHRASRLQFASSDRRSCMLSIYGESSHGQVTYTTSVPEATRALRWDTGDIWHAYDGLSIAGHSPFFSQTMSKTLRDTQRDNTSRAVAQAMLKSVSKHRLGVPSLVEDMINDFIGEGLFYVNMHFETKWTLGTEEEADIFECLSSRHPRVGLRHCWAEQNSGIYGQRTFVNGEEVSEDIFNRHIKGGWR